MTHEDFIDINGAAEAVTLLNNISEVITNYNNMGPQIAAAVFIPAFLSCASVRLNSIYTDYTLT